MACPARHGPLKHGFAVRWQEAAASAPDRNGWRRRSFAPQQEDRMSNQHLKTKTPTDADLKGNPGIGESKGVTMSGIDPAAIEADSTIEGDVDNETTREGGVDPNHLARHNK
jgi:hypothetical protein